MKKLVMIPALVVMIGSNFFGHLLVSAMAGEPVRPAMSRYRKSIAIREGSSLWAITEKCSQDTRLSVRKYMDKLKRMNDLEGDTIRVGNHPTVTYLVAAE